MFNKKTAGLFLGGVLFLAAAGGQAFVSPEHYEKMKKEAQERTRETEKPQPQAQGKIQVHPSTESRTPSIKSGPK